MYHSLENEFKPRAKDETIRTTRWRECSTEAVALSISIRLFGQITENETTLEEYEELC